MTNYLFRQDIFDLREPLNFCFAFIRSTHAKYLVSYRPPRRVINEYGYEVEEMFKMPTSMTGTYTAYKIKSVILITLSNI